MYWRPKPIAYPVARITIHFSNLYEIAMQYGYLPPRPSALTHIQTQRHVKPRAERPINSHTLNQGALALQDTWERNKCYRRLAENNMIARLSCNEECDVLCKCTRYCGPTTFLYWTAQRLANHPSDQTPPPLKVDLQILANGHPLRSVALVCALSGHRRAFRLGPGMSSHQRSPSAAQCISNCIFFSLHRGTKRK